MAIAFDENILGLTEVWWEGWTSGPVLGGEDWHKCACSHQQRSSKFLHARRSLLLVKSPGTVSGCPCTSSAEEQRRSVLGATLIPMSWSSTFTII